MRRMTRQAILLDGWMLPKERAALVGVAAIAFVVNRIGRYEVLGLCTMRVVAARAFDLHAQMLIAEQVRGALELGFANGGVTGETQLGLGTDLQQ